MKRLIALALMAISQLIQAGDLAAKGADNGVKRDPIPFKSLPDDQAIAKTLTATKDKFSLGFFTVPNCHYCRMQKQILQQFHQRYGWQIKEIDTLLYEALAEKFNVEVTPTLVIIKNNATGWIPVSVGAEPLSTIEQNVYRAVCLFNKDIETQESFRGDHLKGDFATPLAVAGSQG